MPYCRHHVTGKVLSLLENHDWRLSVLICKFPRAVRVHGNKSYCAGTVLLNSFVSNRCEAALDVTRHRSYHPVC